jgi:hypothetical protein
MATALMAWLTITSKEALDSKPRGFHRGIGTTSDAPDSGASPNGLVQVEALLGI